MKKYLLLSACLAVLAVNNVQAQSYQDQPRYTNQRQSNYRNFEYTRKDTPRYHRVTSADAARYREPTYHQETYYNEPSVNKARFYIGLDMLHSEMKIDDKIKNTDGDQNILDDNTLSFSGVAGVKFNKNLGIEAYYQQSQKAKKDAEYGLYVDGSFVSADYVTTSISYKSYGMDLIGYVPINQEVELLAALGLGLYDFETKIPGITGISKISNPDDNYYTLEFYTGTKGKYFDSLGIRFGLGAQYNVTDHIALRAMARYVKMTDDDYIKSLTEIALGIRYLF